MQATKMRAPSSTPVLLMSKKNQTLNELTARPSVWHLEERSARVANDDSRIAFVKKQIDQIRAEFDRLECQK